MANNSAFESSDHVVLKGQVTGVTRISKKMKVLFFFGGLGFILFLIFTIFTIDGASDSIVDDKGTQEQESEKGGSTEEPAKADVVTKGIGNGNAAIASNSPAFDLKEVSVLPAPAGAASSIGASIILPESKGNPSVKTGAGDASQAAVIVPAPGSGTAHAVAPMTPAEIAAKRIGDHREQQRMQALSGAMEVSGGWDAGTKPALPANGQFLAGIQGAPGAAGGAGMGFPAPRLQDQDDQNKQVRKESFLREAEARSGQNYLKETKQLPLSKYELKMGWKIPAFLIDGINSDLPGQVCAQVRENVYDSATGKYLLVPQGAKICGTYDSQIAVGQNRLLMVWNRLIFDDGSSLSLAGMPGADQAGYAGFDAEVDNHYFKVFTSALMMSVISAGAQLSQPQQATSPTAAPSASQTAAAALGQQLGQVSSTLIQRDLKIQPTLTQKPGYRFNIQITRDIVFPGPVKRS